MRYLQTPVVMFALLLSALSYAGELSTYKISFKTLACDGSKGYASVDADKVEKIINSKCEKGDAEKEVYQLLVDEGSSYQVFTVSQKEADRLMKRIDEFQDVKKEAIKDSANIIIRK